MRVRLRPAGGAQKVATPGGLRRRLPVLSRRGWPTSASQVGGTPDALWNQAENTTWPRHSMDAWPRPRQGQRSQFSALAVTLLPL